ncbi:MAG: hypothetical protein WAN93_03610, partial [Solirubrobacteraceae bacterium]
MDHFPLRGRGLRFLAGGGGAGLGGCFTEPAPRPPCALGFLLEGVAASRRALLVTFRPGCAPLAEPDDGFAGDACPPGGNPACGFATTFGAAPEGEPAADGPLLAGARPPALRPGVPAAPTLAG